MTELKTLKDIEFDMTITGEKGKKMIMPVCRSELREEARKWIEELERKSNGELIIKEILNETTHMDKSSDLFKSYVSRRRERTQSNYEGIMQFIKHFFNLEEEKNKQG